VAARDVLADLPTRVVATRPWARALVLFGLGALTTLGLPPADFWPIAFVTLPLLLWHLEAAPTRAAAFRTGWWFGFGYFATGWYWISNALLVFSDAFWWMIPFALIGLPGALAVYLGLAALVARLIAGTGADRRLARILALTGALAAGDMLRGVLLTGFPWNVFGYLWSGTESLSQGASVIGVYGLGVAVLLSGLLPGFLPDPRARRIALPLAAAIPLAFLAFGAARLAGAPDFAAQQADTALPGMRMVQPNIPQREKWPRRYLVRNFDLHLRASADGRPDWVSHVIWPETAAAFAIEDPAFESYRAAIAARAVPPGGYLITGAPRRPRDPPALHNSIVILDETGTVRETYDKAHLVPFGEYVPLADILPIQKVTEGAVDFTPGVGPRTLALPGLPPLGPLICYEVIFPGAAVDPTDRPDWILNATNDAWYGDSAGPYQHLQHARMRAVEEGLPLVRPASTGISIAFDAHGREIGRIGLSQAGVLDFRLPPPIQETVFARAGNSIPVALAVFLLAAAGILARHVGKRWVDDTTAP
jgi:apolipoprotein N-acyltransferase